MEIVLVRIDETLFHFIKDKVERFIVEADACGSELGTIERKSCINHGGFIQ